MYSIIRCQVHHNDVYIAQCSAHNTAHMVRYYFVILIAYTGINEEE